MKEGNEAYYSFSLRAIVNNINSFIQHLRKKWWMLALVVFAGAGLGTVYYFRQKPKYEAMTTFILEEKSSSGGGLAGLASQFGFNLGGLTGGGSIFSGDNILDIMKSKKIVAGVLLSKIDSSSSQSMSLADYYLEFTGLRKNWQATKPALGNIAFKDVKNQITPLQDSILNVIYEKILNKNLFTERSSKQSSIIKVKVTAEDCLFARLISERLVSEAANLYINVHTGTAQENIRQLQRRSDSLLLLLNNKSFSAAAVQQLDINPGIRTAAVPVEIATRDKTVIATLYAEVTKNLEASKLLLSQQAPVIQMLDRPGALLDDNKKGILFLLVIFSLISGTLFILFAGAFFYIRNIFLSHKGPELSK